MDPRLFKRLTPFSGYTPLGSVIPYDLPYNATIVTGEGYEVTSIPMNLSEDETGYYAEFQINGVDPEQVDIRIDDTYITVSYERIERNNGKTYLNKEIYGGLFIRSFLLPSQVNTERIEAFYNNGILTLILPKNINKKSKKINIS
ncbi:MAG: hypothetical protein KatS3mg084_0315 [Candidatus Dojkabacteria bacterium]|nr:MAG: hypothetical protein KatS3mg084_0315 [Candidatus Dojkabacteria bacterium]